MGFAMASRLLNAGCDLAVYNRTRAKAEPLAAAGATIVDTPGELANRDIVFTMVSGPADLLAVVTGTNGLLSTAGTPHLVVDCSSTRARVSGFITRDTVEGCTLARAATSLIVTFRVTMPALVLIRPGFVLYC